MTYQKGHKFDKGMTGRKHSEETKRKMSLQKMGSKNPMYGKPISEKQRAEFFKIYTAQNAKNWIVDRTKLKRNADKLKNKDSAYSAWRKTVWLRDNFACKIGNPDCVGRIEAHHILRWAEYPELRYEVNNGITLCHFHHPRKRNDEMRLSPYFQELINSTPI